MQLNRYDNPISVLIPPYTPPGQLIGMAQYIEELGFRDVWVAEDYFENAGFSSAAIVLGATSKLRCGLGIVSSVVRHPAVTAMEIATIGNAFPGRFTPGIGSGVQFWTQQMGVNPKSPISVLHETVSLVRRFLQGETVTQHEGHFFCDSIHLTHGLKDVEILAGVLGPKGLALSGEVADGTLASVMSTPEYIRYAREHISKGAAKSGRDSHAFPVLAIFAADSDGDKAIAAARGIVAHYLLAAGPTPLTECLGYNKQIAELQALGDPEKIAAEMPSEWMDKLVIAGTPSDCVEKINNLIDAGAAQVALTMAMPERLEEQLQLIGQEILPRFKLEADDANRR